MTVATERHIGRSLRNNWVEKVHDQLVEIDITSITDVALNILDINRRLIRAGKTPMLFGYIEDHAQYWIGHVVE
jgi:hypothetical protein